MEAAPALLAVLGYPVAHSLSPIMHQAALAAEGLEGRYIACPVEPARLGAALEGLGALGFLGCNVTVPHKEAACRHATQRSPAAAATGSANTLRFLPDGRVQADSTDGPGLLEALRRELGWSPTGRRVLLLGAGGAARAIAFAMASQGAARVGVHNRTTARAQALADELGGGVRAVPAGELDVHLADADIVVNCTTLGLGGQGQALTASQLEVLTPSALVCDIVYAPEDTPLLRAARRRWLTTVGGLGMLACQAALAWECWFGRRGPIDVMLEAARRELAHRAARS